MRPLSGIVRSASKKKGLLVRLESGLEVEMQYREGIKVGDKVWVGFDFTTMSAKYIEKPGSYVHPIGAEHVEEEQIFLGQNDEGPDEDQWALSTAQ